VFFPKKKNSAGLLDIKSLFQWISKVSMVETIKKAPFETIQKAPFETIEILNIRE
jgi:hypothetical protein